MNALLMEHTVSLTVVALITLAVLVIVLTCICAILFRSLKVSSNQLNVLLQLSDFNAQSNARTERLLNEFEEKLTVLNAHSQSMHTASFQQPSVEEAARMASRGAPARALVDACGLSDGEAELMVRLRRETLQA